jgi:nucleotide-binding universal stress UspA family protein
MLKATVCKIQQGSGVIPEGGHMYQHILVPVDGSTTSDRSLREAIKFAQQHGSQLRFIHVMENILLPDNEVFLDYAALQEVVKRNGNNILEMAAILSREAGLKAETVLSETTGERVASVIVAEAQRWPADLIIIGTHGRSGFNRLLFGSVAEGVVRAAQTPVLLIRAN